VSESMLEVGGGMVNGGGRERYGVREMCGKKTP
jgi:hypothetical protein